MDVAVLGEVSVTGLTLNVTTLPVGMLETLSFTFPLKVFRGVRVIGNRADVPALMVSIDVFGLSEKLSRTHRAVRVRRGVSVRAYTLEIQTWVVFTSGKACF